MLFNDKVNLHVYKASAGSGKTHRLTEEYLHLLFSSEYAYRHILAVTFTNKATDEMKNRIISELANLATGKKSDYIKSLSEEYKLNEIQVRERARNTLIRILHDYSSFSVSTIDKFFQQTMRAFTREIGLGGGYNVELDTGKVLSEAIDSMLYDLESSDNKLLLDWLIRFSEEKVENGETWNIRNDIQSLSSEIFKESYKAYSDKVQSDIADKQLMTDYKDMLFAIIQTFENTSQQTGEKALNIMERYTLTPEDFKGGARSPFFSFIKWANKTVTEPTNTFRLLADDVSNWYTAKATAETKAKIESAYTELNACVCDIVAHYDDSKTYQTAYEINRYFFTLGILADVDSKIRKNASENNIMLISDTTELLNRIIEGNESPFIYEKVGMRISNYMIDEFQDTSGMQWQNFLPLVRDSLSAGNKDFIVGDVKQSIYRWRNSDWKLLDEQLDKDFETEGINHETLNANWRSARNVIMFNNAIFLQGAQLLQETYNRSLEDVDDKRLQPFLTRITKAYDELIQYIPESHKDNEGHVKVEFIENTEEQSWQDQVLERLPSQIELLQDKGYSLKDIAILVRTKKEGADVANRLLEYKSSHPDSKYRYDIISDEALFVGNSKSIKLIIALLKYLHTPTDNSLKALAVYEYFKYNNQLNAEDALQKYFSAKDELPAEITAELSRIRELPLYEMTEEIFNLFRSAMEDNEQIYMQSFLDMVLDFTVRYSSDLDSFLKWWDDTGVNKTIFTPDEQDAIRIMTIHKSKGLGFNVVLIPFCNWEIDHKLTTILWCHPEVAPFDRLHLVPVKYSQKLKNTIFSYEYFDERLHAFIDNINILYVAFTRAKNELIIYSPKPKRDEINNISSLLWASINNEQATNNNALLLSLNKHIDEDEGIFEIGENYSSQKEDNRKDTKEISIDALPSIQYDSRVKLRLKNKYYFSDTGKRDYGILMHEIVSKINTISDIDRAVQEYLTAGDITKEQEEEINDKLRQYLSSPIVSSWYSGEYKVLNEVQILQPKGTFSRPDRVMIKDGEVIVIDYKFGQKEDRKYIRQVKYYMEQIRKMGYENIKGYVCYIALGKVVEI
ncbi:exodeoxyribonuclease V subunit beta [Dysgonomonas sp. BGC7]|uniref:UvrD-helicase domain-containing protein n=1 Tax=Dysgonomonas sp. BGC7 TaxID=1658008 RepID=UPI000680FD68|nr:UvrD-helicase domain-containing protein [Dysgonomonas sp. BGC7]MBD8390006.1 UvrD-helicase domain-containing protein [Dysgonomonas sp. BGC7]